MKLVRFLSKNDVVTCGILQADGSIDIVVGDVFGVHTRSGEKCSVDDIKQYMTPVDIPAIVALGGNYADHAKECKEEVPELPLVFLKAYTSLTPHLSEIVLPKIAPLQVDYEAELGVIIAKRAKNITPAQAADFIFGYTCVNDVSARDCQLKIDRQWARGKSFDTFAPVGPVVETELDPTDVRVRSFLYGECMQDDTTAHLVCPVYDVVSYLSKNMTLMPGTLVITGTPAGVGFAREPQVFLKPGDNVVVDVEGVGRLENTVVSES